MQTVRFPAALPLHTPGSCWIPTMGDEFKAFLDKCHPDARVRIERESLRVLEVCVKPGDQFDNAVLVMGYVQSGKTSSFTGVSALAKDNGFRLVIIIGGTTKLLVGQTSKRLRKDLRLTDPDAYNRWSICESPTTHNQEGRRLIASVTRESADPRERSLQCGIPLVVVMKHQKHLQELSDCLAECARANGGNLNGVSALIIDDEAHMHSPNIGSSGTVSAIYRQLKVLRKHFASHSFLQYTATPQANLVTEIQDQFAPAKVRLLATGEGYAGGKEFFIDRCKSAIRVISAAEANAARNARFGDPAPPSLQSALASYLLVAANDLIREGKAAAHSMLVHSDMRNVMHQTFESWLTELKTSWLDLLREARPNWDAGVVGILRREYDDLSAGNPGSMRDFEEVIGSIPFILQRTNIQLINQSEKTRPDFSAAPYWIVNGGNQLGVGYTVEGLTTTHMLRSPGVGQSDTIQQRGRFFGYRGSGVNNCRVWLEEESRAAFTKYVEHEEALRASVQEYDANNLPFGGWKRKFILDPSLELTRRTAIKLGLMTFKPLDGWVSQLQAYSDEMAARNRKLIEEFERGMLFPASTLDPQRYGSHQRGLCSRDQLLELLAKYAADGSDRDKLDTVAMVFATTVAGESNDCEVIKMGRGSAAGARRRTVDKNQRITLHQGRSADIVAGYLGDAKIHADGDARVTLQIHRIDLDRGVDGISPDVPFIALRLTSSLQQRCERVIIEQR